MGKKLKPKPARNPSKSAGAAPAVPTADRGSGGPCDHYSKNRSDLNQILLAIQSSLDVAAACEDCRGEQAPKRGGKEKGKQQKKKGGAKKSESKAADSDFHWVCLDCNRVFCGGAVNVSEPYGHARRHAKLAKHAWAVRLDDPSVSWCFVCDSRAPVELPEIVDFVLEVNPPPLAEAESSDNLEDMGHGYVVRGLSNLGNTCFFNSVMQNLFAMNMLREYLAQLERPSGPLTMALKKLFAETGAAGVESKGTLIPKGLFGCVCAKAPQFRGYQQQDSHELLRCLLDGLHMEEVSARSLDDSMDDKRKENSRFKASFVDDLFGGQISSTVSCAECGHTSTVKEPFLDLSLPLPSKKPSPKKVPVLPARKGKMPPRQGNRGRRFREKAVAKGLSPGLDGNQHTEENLSSISDCSASCAPATEKEGVVIYGGDLDFAWMDYLEPDVLVDATDSVGDASENFVGQCSITEKHGQNEDCAQCSSDSVHAICSKEPVEPSESCVDSTGAGEMPSSSGQSSGVILLPYKEPEEAIEDSNREALSFSGQKNVVSVDAPTEETSVHGASVAGFAQAEEFDGFGDLFNEPEVTSDLKTETGGYDDVEMTSWAYNSWDSNQDEVDDTDSPISVNSCLALFTKPEILSDEHAWHCERCSEILCQQKLMHKKGEQRTVVRHTEPLKSLVDGAQVSNVRTSSKFEINSLHPVEPNLLGNGKVVFTSETEAGILTCKPEEVEDNSLISDEQAQCADVIMKYEGLTQQSGQNSQNISYPLGQDKANLQSRYHENGSCCINNLIHDKCNGQDLAALSSSSLDCTQTVVQSSFENDNVAQVKKLGKKGEEMMGESCSEDGSEDEDVKRECKKVKRDATKRILIHRSPPILTIHLKRFSQDARGRLNKLRGHVSFQETLDLKPFMDTRCEERNCSYRLLGVVEHSGSMSGGHYVAYVRGERSKGKAQKSSGSTWFYVSDAHIREVTLSEVLRSDAYILFYERIQQ